jgi:hypothetical protein
MAPQALTLIVCVHIVPLQQPVEHATASQV